MPKKLIDYVVEFSDDTETLQDLVLALSKKGYELYGPLCVSHSVEKDVEGDWFYQVMVKYEEDN